MTTAEVDRLYREGIAAIRKGDKAAGRDLLMQVVEMETTHEQGWLWLSAAVEGKEDQIVCLENVLTINPHNETARRGLRSLGVEPPPVEELPARPAFTSSSPPDPPPPPRPAPFMSSEEHPAAPLHPDRMEHAPSRLMESGFREKTRYEKQQEAKRREEAYQSLLPADFESSSSLVTYSEGPQRTLMDLFDAWFAALIFRREGTLEEELRYGHFLNAFLNLGVGTVLRFIGRAIPLVIFLLVPGRLMAFTEGALAPFAPSQELIDLQRDMEELGLLSEADISLPELDAGMLATLGVGIPVLLFGFFVVTVIGTFLTTMLSSWVIDQVAHALGGKGDVIKTLQALTIASAVTGIVTLPIGVLTPFIGFWLAAALGTALTIYQFAMTAFMVGVAQKMGILVSAGVVIFSGGVARLITSVFFLICNLMLALLPS